MTTDQHNWHLFEIRFRVSADGFDKEAFVNDVKDTVQQELSVYGWSFGSTREPGKQRADMMIDFRRERYVRVRIVYHRTDFEVEDARPPFMEDCASWLGSFIKETNLMARMDVAYVFEDGYSSLVSLPFPLLTVASDREFEGASVTGIAIQLTNGQRVTIDRQDDTIFLGLSLKGNINLKEFQLERSLDCFSSIVDKLINTTEQAS